MLSSIISQLQTNPLAFFASLLIEIPAVLLALTCHEVAHGYVAMRCGDKTAYMMGRLSLNPLHHLDPIGTLCMLFLGFGWAKPVPVNPRNFKNYRRDDFLVSIAGITVNLILFFLTTLLMVGVNQIMLDFSSEVMVYSRLAPYDFLSVKEGFFWSIYAGETDYLLTAGVVRVPWLLYVQRFLMVFSTLNLGLAVFNILPIPPLDGYHLVNDTLLKGRLQLTPKMHYAFMIGMLLLCFGTDVVSNLMSVATSFVQNGVVTFLTSVFGLM